MNSKCLIPTSYNRLIVSYVLCTVSLTRRTRDFSGMDKSFFESALAYRHFHGKHFDIIMNIIVYDLSYSGVSKQDKIRLDI